MPQFCREPAVGENCRGREKTVKSSQPDRVGPMRGTGETPHIVRLRVLGGFELRLSDGPPVPGLGRKARGLLACLALEPGKAWPRERLMALLWGDRGEDQARASLRQTLADIRRVIGPEIVRTGDDTISLAPESLAVDALDFDRSATAGRWQEAAALYQGPLLEGHGLDGGFEDWLRDERNRLQERAVEVLERVVGSQSGEAAVLPAQRLLALDPTREQTHRLLMRLYAGIGDRGKALRQYQLCREILERELQAKPDAGTERLYREIKDADMPAPASAADAKREMPSEVKAAIVVMIFANMSGDPAQDYFSSGITEDIVTELARFRFLSVVAGATKAADPRAEGARLGARYVVDGQVRRAGDHVRVTVHLIDLASGNHVWAERFDRAFDDIFAVQDEIAQRIVENVVPRVEADGIEIARRKPPGDMRAYDYYLRAKALFQWPRDVDDLRKGRDCSDRAITLDPEYARAHAQKAFSYIIGFYLMESHDAEAWSRQAVACAETAVQLDPMDGFCHWALGEASFLAGALERARDHMALALKLNPNDTDVHVVSGFIRAFTGDGEAGLTQIDLAIDRNPTHPSWYHWVRANILYILGRFEEALRDFNLHSPINSSMRVTRAAVLVELGRMEEARTEIKALLAVQPGASIAVVSKSHGSVPDLDHYLACLRLAGLPER